MRKAEELSITTAPAALAWRHELAAARGAGAEEGDVDALEGGRGQLLDLVRLALELERLADRAGRGEQLQGSDGEVPSLEDAEDFYSDRAGGADDGDILGVHDGPEHTGAAAVRKVRQTAAS